MRPSTDVHDYEVRLRSAEKFLKKVRHRSTGAVLGVEAQLLAVLWLPLMVGVCRLPFFSSVEAADVLLVDGHSWTDAV